MVEFLLPLALFLAAEPRADSRAASLPSGHWELLSAFEMSGLPMAPEPRRAAICLDAADTKDPRRLLAAIPLAGSECAIRDLHFQGGALSWTAACSGRYHGAAAGELAFAADSARGRIRMQVEDSRGAAHEVAYRVEAKRSGACPP